MGKDRRQGSRLQPLGECRTHPDAIQPSPTWEMQKAQMQIYRTCTRMCFASEASKELLHSILDIGARRTVPGTTWRWELSRCPRCWPSSGRLESTLWRSKLERAEDGKCGWQQMKACSRAAALIPEPIRGARPPPQCHSLGLHTPPALLAVHGWVHRGARGAAAPRQARSSQPQSWFCVQCASSGSCMMKPAEMKM